MARPARRTTQEKKAAQEATGEFYVSLDAVLPVIIAAVTKEAKANGVKEKKVTGNELLIINYDPPCGGVGDDLRG